MTRAFGHGPMNFGMMSPAIKGLIIANVAVFVLQNLVGRPFIPMFGLTPNRVVNDLYVWQLFTYLFLHASFMHLLFNLFALWMFGMPVEARWGQREFLKFVLICGIGAGLVNVLAAPDSDYATIGASGAVYGLLVAFAMLYPDAVVYLYFFFPIKAKHMAILFGVLEFLAGTSGSDPMVARFAHLGGMAIGYLYIRWWGLVSSYWTGLVRELLARFGGAQGRRRKKTGVKGESPVSEARKGGDPDLDDDAAEVDRILDKILAQGEGSLTEAERQTLRRQALRKPKGHA